MSSFALNAAPFLKEEIIETKRPLMSIDEISGRLKEKTVKLSEKDNNEYLNNQDDDDDNSEYADFNATNNGELEKTNEVNDAYAYENVGFFEDNFKKLNNLKEGFNSKEEDINFGSGDIDILDNGRSLEKKLNYLIQILELQKDQRTEYVSEEIILYIFLGIFIVYTIDSFVRVGKYTR